MSQFPTYEFATGSREDHDWRTYFDFLYPPPLSMQQIMNRRVVERLKKNGDDPNLPRDVDHGVFLPSNGALSAFVEYVKAEGFLVTGTPPEPGSDGRFFLELKRRDKPSEIDAVVTLLHAKALELGGVYDGWGCLVVPSNHQ